MDLSSQWRLPLTRSPSFFGENLLKHVGLEAASGSRYDCGQGCTMEYQQCTKAKICMKAHPQLSQHHFIDDAVKKSGLQTAWKTDTREPPSHTIKISLVLSSSALHCLQYFPQQPDSRQRARKMASAVSTVSCKSSMAVQFDLSSESRK